MAQVFSWKVAPGKYSYLFPDENGSHIRARVTDSTTLYDMANRVSVMTKDDYRTAYESMRSEVVGIYGSSRMPDSYEKYYYISGLTYENVVLLSGQDGYGAEGYESGLIDEKDYRALEAEIDRMMQEYQDRLMAEMERIKAAIEGAASQDIGNALNMLVEAQEEISEMKERLQQASESAQNALDAARNLSQLSDITPEQITEVLALNNQMSSWLDTYQDKLTSLWVDYDRATGEMGGIGTGADPARGMFSLFAESINIISGTVGTVNTEWAANSGLIRNVATWYDESAQTYANVVREMDASRAAIQDLVEFYDPAHSAATRLRSYIDASIGEIGDQLIYEEGRFVNTINERMNVVSGLCETNMASIQIVSGSVKGLSANTNAKITTINTKMSTMSGLIETAMTIAETADEKATHMQNTWSQESGILQTVSSLVVKKDSEGYGIYYWINPNDSEDRKRVYLMGVESTSDGPVVVYNTKKNGTGTRYTTNVYPEYVANTYSYIKQTVDSIDLTVTSGDVLASLSLYIDSGDGSTIAMKADRVLIDSQIIANSLITKAANIGGVHIGAGMISAQTGNKKWAITSAGTLEATSAKIKGGISADTGYFSGTVYANQGSFKGSISATSGFFSGAVYANTGKFKGSISATSGFFSGAVYANEGKFRGGISATSLYLGSDAKTTLNNWVSTKGYAFSADVATKEAALRGQIASAKSDTISMIYDVCGKTAAAMSLASAVSAAQTSIVVGETEVCGGTRHTMNINGHDYSWDTYEAGDYILVDTKVGNGTTGGVNNGTMVMIDKNGLLQANNALIYGSIFASEGYFKGAVSANSGFFSGEVQATKLSVGNQSIEDFVEDLIPEGGVTTGTVQSMINNSSGWIVTNARNGMIEINETYGGNSQNVKITTDGLLTAKNAMISGSVYATRGVFNGDIYARNGVFQGTVSAASIYASDIYLNGNALKLSGASNTFQLSDEEIVVEEVPEDVTISQNSYTYSSIETTNSGACAAQFRAMGNSVTVIPPHSIQAFGTRDLGWTTEVNGSVRLTCAVYSANTQNYYAYGLVNGSVYPDLTKALSYGTNIVTFQMGSSDTSKDIRIDSSFVGIEENYYSNYSLNCIDGVDYVIIFVWETNGIPTGNFQQFSIEFPKYSFVNAPNPVDTQFFRIGKNGMQLFLGNGFYFTAAARGGGQGPIIAMGGQNTQGQMFGLRLTRPSGIQILTGKPGEGWKTPS